MFYANCLVGALILMARLRTWKLRVVWKRRVFPHFYVIDANGVKWHFEGASCEPCLPILYRGSFRIIL